MIEYDVDAEGVREMLAKLKDIDPKLVTQFRKELRDTAKGMATTIQSSIQVTPPLSGMGGYTPRSLIWQGAKARVSISMAGSRERDVTPLLAIKVDSPKGAPGYIAAESAGSKGSSGNTPQGTHFIAMMTQKFGPLKGKGGNRIAWKYFWGQRDLLNRAAGMVVDKFERMVTNEMDR
jgi:nicotinamide mononucleotide (NMN) deamidase PncC